MFNYCKGSEFDIESTIRIDYEAYSQLDVNYKPRRLIDMSSNFSKNPAGLVLAKNEKLYTVGFIYTRQLGVLGWCGPMAVLPDFENKGIGMRLLLEAENLLKKNGCETIGFETTPNLITYYLKQGWIATSITYSLSYRLNDLVFKDLLGDQIVLNRVTSKKLISDNSFVKMKNGVNFYMEIATEVELNTSEFFEVRYNNTIIGVILSNIQDNTINIKIMNILTETSNDWFLILQKILNTLCKFYNVNEVTFSMNTEYMNLITMITKNRDFRIKEYSIRFQSRNSKIINYDDMSVAYHWGTN